MVSSRMFVTKQFGYEQRRDSKRTMRDCRSIAFMVHNLDKKITAVWMAYGAALGIDDVTIMNGWIIGICMTIRIRYLPSGISKRFPSQDPR